jgi:hypothetical protein
MKKLIAILSVVFFLGTISAPAASIVNDAPIAIADKDPNNDKDPKKKKATKKSDCSKPCSKEVKKECDKKTEDPDKS